MNHLSHNPFELAARLILQQNEGVRHLVSNISKAKSLTHADQLFRQREYYQKVASLAFCCSPCSERSQILELCHHGINDCDNEFRRLVMEALRDRTIEKYADNGNQEL